MSTKTRRHGASLNQLFGTVAVARLSPDLVKFRFVVQNDWDADWGSHSTIDGVYGESQEHHLRPQLVELDASGPPVPVVGNTELTPIEYALHALAASLTGALVYHARARGIELREVHVDLEGDVDLRAFLGLSPDHRPGCESLRVNIRVSGDATEERLRELCALVEQRSSVLDLIRNPVPVAFEIEPAQAPPDTSGELRLVTSD